MQRDHREAAAGPVAADVARDHLERAVVVAAAAMRGDNVAYPE